MLSRIVFYIIVKPLSILPLWLLYQLAYLAYFILYYILRYRRDVVINNLQRSFPDLDLKEIHKISRNFYHHLTNLMAESVKNFSISKSELIQRINFSNIELINDVEDENIVIITGHYGNWEMTGLALNLNLKDNGKALYKPMTDPFFNKKILESRRRMGLELISLKELSKLFREQNNRSAIVFINDQWPHNPKKAIWVEFLNQQTAFFNGAEKYAKLTHAKIFFAEVIVKSRGMYEVVMHKINNDDNITDSCARILEKSIQVKPEYWLWSHKRWKKSKEEVYK